MSAAAALAFLFSYAVVVCGCEAATAVVLWHRAGIERSGAYRVLAVGYSVGSLCLALNTVLLLGTDRPVPATLVPWLWSHAVVPAAVLIGCAIGPRPVPAFAAVVATFASVALVGLTTLLPGPFPTILAPGARLTAASDVYAAVGIALNLLALVVLRRRSPFGASTARWLTVALGAFALNETLALIGQQRFSPLWFAARALGMLASASLLCGFLGDTLHRVRELERALRRSRDVNESLAALVRREQSTARALQEAFAPGALPEIPGIEVVGAYRPAAQESLVGGDWYDVFLLPDGRVGITIGDVMGHGLEAAATMLRAREMLRASLSLASTPAEAIVTADRTLAANARLASAIVATLDPRDGRLWYASAGHPPPIVAQQGRSRALRGGGALLGLGIATDTTEAVRLRPGDALLFYTDGLIEANRDAVAGERALLAAFGADAQPDALLAALVGEAPHDDVALLRLRLGAAALAEGAGWRFASDNAATARDARASFVAYLAGAGFDPIAVHEAEVAFGELVGNVVRHAPGPIEIALDPAAGGYLLAVRDRGPGFDPPPFALPDDLAESGRGLFIAASFGLGPVVRRRRGGGAEVSVVLQRPDQSPASSARNPSSSRIAMPSDSALTSFEPASSPATT